MAKRFVFVVDRGEDGWPVILPKEITTVAQAEAYAKRNNWEGYACAPGRPILPNFVPDNRPDDDVGNGAKGRF